MGKLCYLFLVSCLIGFALPTFADTTPDGQPILYCPHHVECSTDGKISSCHLSDNLYETWGAPESIGRVIKGVYELKIVDAAYQNDSLTRCGTFDARCIYTSIDNYGMEHMIMLRVNGCYTEKNNNSFQALIVPMSQWSVSWGTQAECLSNNPKTCPLIESPEITYLSQYPGTTRGSDGQGFYWNNETALPNEISYYKLLDLCGATTVCEVNIGKYSNVEHKFELTGMVTLNLMTPDIVKIDHIDTDVSSPCTLKKKEPFNTIYCEPKKLIGATNE